MGEQWSKCFEKPAKGIASRNRRAMPAYQCPLARRNQKVGSPGRICRRLCAGSIATCGPLSSLPSQQWMTPDPRQTPKKSSSIVASPALVAAALTPFPLRILQNPALYSRRFRAYSRFVILSMQCRHYASRCQRSVVIVAPTFHYPATAKLITGHRVCPAPKHSV